MKINSSYEKMKGQVLIIAVNSLCLLKLEKGICKTVLLCKK